VSIKGKLYRVQEYSNYSIFALDKELIFKFCVLILKFAIFISNNMQDYLKLKFKKSRAH